MSIHNRLCLLFTGRLPHLSTLSFFLSYSCSLYPSLPLSEGSRNLYITLLSSGHYILLAEKRWISPYIYLLFSHIDQYDINTMINYKSHVTCSETQGLWAVNSQTMAPETYTHHAHGDCNPCKPIRYGDEITNKCLWARPCSEKSSLTLSTSNNQCWLISEDNRLICCVQTCLIFL